MQVFASEKSLADSIKQFESHGAWSIKLGKGEGECHVYTLHFDSPGEIGPHEAGFDQLFIIIDGSGWGAGADGIRVALNRGQVVLFRRGEVHSKGSDSGMTAIMIQTSHLLDSPLEPID